MIFEGFESWSENEPLVEIHVGERIIDLHNWGSFVGFEYHAPETLIVKFLFDETEGGRRPGSPAAEVRLRFEGMDELEVQREAIDELYESDTLSDLFYRRVSPVRGRVQITMMDGFSIKLVAGLVALDVATVAD